MPAFQDDGRENILIDIFKLSQPEDRSRSDIDAWLSVGNVKYPFELKSSASNSVTTARDFGRKHIEKWQDKHWLIGFFDRAGVELKYALYGSPARMNPWIRKKAEYISRDYALGDIAAEIASEHLNESHLDSVMGRQEIYSLEDAKVLYKNKWKIEEYHTHADLPDNHFSRSKMLEILKLRIEYLMNRGSTLNNPHIPGSYFDGWEKITNNHAAKLRQMVRNEL